MLMVVSRSSRLRLMVGKRLVTEWSRNLRLLSTRYDRMSAAQKLAPAREEDKKK